MRFLENRPSSSSNQKCHSGEHHAVAAQAQISEGVGAEAVEDLELVEVSNSKVAAKQLLTDGQDGADSSKGTMDLQPTFLVRILSDDYL